MLKSIVVAVDASPSSVEAEKLALAIAGNYGSRLVGIGVLDTPFFTAPMARPIGAGAYKQHRDETLVEAARERLEVRIKEFEAACASAGLAYGAVEAEGVPHKLIETEADRHDLIVVGRETNFHGVEKHDIADVVQRLLHDNPRPVVMVPPAPQTGGRVVVAFDGSRESSRAMHMYILLGLAKEQEPHVVSIAANRAEAAAIASRGADLFRSHGFAAEAHGVAAHETAAKGAGLFRSHGFDAEAHGIAARGNPADAILSHVESMNAGMLVMGAWGRHSLVHNILVGSATRRLLHDCPAPVFVHH